RSRRNETRVCGRRKARNARIARRGASTIQPDILPPHEHVAGTKSGDLHPGLRRRAGCRSETRRFDRQLDELACRNTNGEVGPLLPAKAGRPHHVTVRAWHEGVLYSSSRSRLVRSRLEKVCPQVEGLTRVL